MLRDLLRTRPGRIAAVATFALAVATAIAMAILWPTGESDAKLAPTLSQRTELAQVVTVKDVECSAPGLRNCRRVRVAVKRGPDEGRAFELDEGGGPSPLPLGAGDRLRVARNAQTEGAPELQPYAIADFDRRSPMLWLLITFVVIVAVLGRRRAVMALVGLGVSLGVVILFVVPAILGGRAPLAVALAGGLAVMLATIALAHGLGPKSIAAALGTAASLGLTVGLALAFTELAHLSGFASEEAALVQASGADISLSGLVLAGMVIGALGVLDDVAATVNTLVLAYAGASLPILLVFSVGATPFSDAVNGEAVAEQIVATLVGSIGLIAAVPITTALAALLASRLPAERLPTASHAH